MRVVDQAEERALLGCFGEQREDCERHAIEIRRIVVAERERASQRRRLRFRKPLQQPEYGAQKLMQRGERQLSLRFNTPRLEHRHVVHRGANLVDQRRLARSRLSDQDKAAAPAGARIVQQRLQLRLLCFASEELCLSRSRRHGTLTANATAWRREWECRQPEP